MDLIGMDILDLVPTNGTYNYYILMAMACFTKCLRCMQSQTRVPAALQKGWWWRKYYTALGHQRNLSVGITSATFLYFYKLHYPIDLE